MARALLILVLAAFGVYSGYVVYEVGYLGILHSHLSNAGGIQVFCDLAVSLSLACIWMLRDARASGRNAWPYLIATLFLGSFGPLLYLLFRPAGEARSTARLGQVKYG